MIITKYSIPCTPEQTRKARELGAPIEVKSIEDAPKEWYGKAYFTGMSTCAKIPTAEEMIGWLEEQEDIEEITILRHRAFLPSWAYLVTIKQDTGLSPKNIYSSRREATLAAIDAALEYLLNNNYK